MGAEIRHTAIIEAPEGPISFAYLWISHERFVDLPDLRREEPLAPDKIAQIARRLGLDAEIFWPGFRGFDGDDDPPEPNLYDQEP